MYQVQYIYVKRFILRMIIEILEKKNIMYLFVKNVVFITSGLMRPSPGVEILFSKTISNNLKVMTKETKINNK